MLPEILDSHCHLDLPPLISDLDSVLEHARQNGVSGIVVPAVTTRPDSRLLTARQRFPNGIFLAVGKHPCYLTENENLERIKSEIETSVRNNDPRIVAIGETGLDKRYQGTWSLQVESFKVHCAVARSLELPLIVHCVRAYGTVLEILRSCRPLKGVIHAFSGSAEVARELIELGFFLGIGGLVTRPNAKTLRDQIGSLPASSILLETDAPDMAPMGIHGHNKPGYLASILSTAAELRRESRVELARITSENTRNLFALGATSLSGDTD